MAATIKGTANAAAATSVTIPTHAIGDLIVIFAYRDGSNTVPSKPAASGTVPAWVDIDAATGANTNSARSAYFVATATNHTSGTWTSSTGMVAVVIQGQAASPIGDHAVQSGSTANLATAPAITQQQTTGKALILEFYGHRTVTAWSTAPTGYTRQASVSTEVCFNTKDSSTSDGSITQVNTAIASGWRGQTIEIIAPDTAPTTALNTPADAATGISTTPTLNFTGTDAEGDSYEARVQVDTVTTFNSQVSTDPTGLGISDNFDDNSLGAIWTNFGGVQVVETSQQLQITTQATTIGGYYGVNSTASYDITGKSVTVQLVSAGNQSFVSLDAIFQIEKADLTGDEQINMFVEHGLIILRRRSAATNSDISISYDSTNHKWLRIREASDTFYFDTSADGEMWVNRRFVSNPFTDKTHVVVTMTAGTYASEASASTVIFDNLNVVPSPLLDKVSTTDVGFTAGHPFASGAAKDYTVQAGDILSNSTLYYWRVATTDPLGTNSYGAWATTRSFTTISSGGVTTFSPTNLLMGV